MPVRTSTCNGKSAVPSLSSIVTLGRTVETAPAQSDTDWSLTLTKGDATLQATTSPANDDQESDQTELSLILTGSG